MEKSIFEDNQEMIFAATGFTKKDYFEKIK